MMETFPDYKGGRDALLTDRRKLLAGVAALTGAACARQVTATTTMAEMRSVLDLIPAEEHAAIRSGTSSFDCGPAIEKAVNEGASVFLPAGRYAVAAPIVFDPRVSGRFAPGVSITGEGPGRTVIVDRSKERALFDFDSGADAGTGFRAITGVHLAGFSIEGRAAGPRTSAIRFRGCYQSSVRRVYILGRPGDGILIPCLFGDIDGSNMVDLEEVRIEDCGGWGLDALAVPGRNEISFLNMKHVFIQTCGTADRSAEPRSGGMRWKGQMLTMVQCAFTVNQNVGLFIVGAPGLGVNVQLSSTTFENNLGRHLLCTGVAVLRGTNLQFFSNDQHKVRTACEFSAVTQTVRGVQIDGVLVRATAGNTPYTAFHFHGSHIIPGSNDVRNVTWDDFGHAGQVRAIGDLPSLPSAK